MKVGVIHGLIEDARHLCWQLDLLKGWMKTKACTISGDGGPGRKIDNINYGVNVDHVKSQVDRSFFPDGYAVAALTSGRRQ